MPSEEMQRKVDDAHERIKQLHKEIAKRTMARQPITEQLLELELLSKTIDNSLEAAAENFLNE